MISIKGADISTLIEVEANGGKFYDQGILQDPLVILQHYGFNYVRLRLWNDPYAADGRPYSAGTNDLNMTLKLAKRAKDLGLSILLDLHYSDFWADPGKQNIPKAWAEGASVESLKKHVFDYTKMVMHAMKEAGTEPDMVQVGNELSNGLLWPFGKMPNYDNIAAFVNAGIDGVRAENAEIPIMIHLDNGGKNELYRDWFDHYMDRRDGRDFQIIGLSYYPFWHGSLNQLKQNMDDIAQRYGKDLAVAEVSMGFTMEDYAAYEQLSADQRKGYATKPELIEKIEHPMTVEGQCRFMEDFAKVLREVPDNRGLGFFYWEPCWLPVPNVGWASEAALEYTKEAGPGGNEWANQALFDYDGNALPTLEVIRRL